MKEYHKIQSIFKRDENGRFIMGQWTLPEFEYLANNMWSWTEKVDGTNIRVMWDALTGTVKFGGRTDNAQMPVPLLRKLEELFPLEKFQGKGSMCLYGEGYGNKIQKVGSRYIPNGVSFVLFDVNVNEWWLKRESVEEIGKSFGIDVVPIIGTGTIYEAIVLVKNGFKSQFGDLLAEGLVIKPLVELKCRNGDRIITKIKHVDFKS